MRSIKSYRTTLRFVTPIVLLLFIAVPRADGEQLIRLQNGLTLRGVYIELASIDQNGFSAAASSDGVQARPIWAVDDGLRRTYIHRRGMVAAEPVDVPRSGPAIDFFSTHARRWGPRSGQWASCWK